MACAGSSAKAARDQLLHSARVFLRPEVFGVYFLLVPNLRWFQAQREALGNEAWLYSMLEVSQAEECLQHGFDETSIDGTPTLNQWVTYPSIGPAFRAKDGRNLKKIPSNGEDKVEYLKNVLLQMMKADSRRHCQDP